MPHRGEFRATTDQMLEIIDELRRVEETKQQVPVGSPEFVASAKRAEELSRLAFRWAQMQLQMAFDANNRITAGNLPAETRLITVEARPLDRVLANWREAQLRLEISQPGSPEAEAAVRDIERLREEYQIGHELQLGTDGTGARTDGSGPPLTG
jgi:hypothetical protein